MNQEEKNAIANLKRAFTRCRKAGFVFSGIDDELHFCTRKAYEKARSARQEGDFNEVAIAVRSGYEGTGTVVSGGCYIDSAGW